MIELALWLGPLLVIALGVFGSAWLLDLMLRRRSAATRRTIWALAIVIALVLPLTRVVISPPVLALDRGLASGFVVIWAGGALMLLARLLHAGWVVRRWIVASEPLRSPAWQADLAALRGERERPAIELRRCSAIEGPVCVGLWRSRILIPDTMLELPTESRRSLLAHELAHALRSDAALLIVGALVRSLYWMVPLAWLALRRLREQAENAADDAVLGAGVASSSYAGQLVALARAQLSATGLRERVLAILDAQRPRSASLACVPRWHAAGLVGLAVLLASMVTACEARSDRPQSDRSPSATITRQ
ncbi:M56 family metallopeptidase [Nannocystaceae bacterium ST9]